MGEQPLHYCPHCNQEQPHTHLPAEEAAQKPADIFAEELFEDRLPCLDKGYVRLVTWMPWNMAEKVAASQSPEGMESLTFDLEQNDLTVVNAAKASHMRESLHLTRQAAGLIHFLGSNGHSSPFRHGVAQFEIKAPLMVARQWFKYRVGSVHSEPSYFEGQGDDGADDPLYARNESSRRYVTEEPEFYSPDVWRNAPENRKQGSGPNRDDSQSWKETLNLFQHDCLEAYRYAIEQGIAPEMARLFLPAYGLYITWRWTASIQGIAHFLTQRLEEDAQKEIQDYAWAVYKLIKQPQVYPLAIKELVTDPLYG